MNWKIVNNMDQFNIHLMGMFVNSDSYAHEVLDECFDFHEKGVIGKDAEIRNIVKKLFKKDAQVSDLILICLSVFYIFSLYNSDKTL